MKIDSVVFNFKHGTDFVTVLFGEPEKARSPHDLRWTVRVDIEHETAPHNEIWVGIATCRACVTEAMKLFRGRERLLKKRSIPA